MKRISLRLSLALLTFFIGISLTTFWMFVYYPKPNLPSPSVITESANEQVKTFEITKSMFDASNIEIEYGWSLMGIDALDGWFYVKNNSGGTIHYLGYGEGDNRRSWIKQNGKVKATNTPNGEGVKEQELKPNEETIFTIPVPQNEKPFEAGFSFQIGNEREEKTIWVKVKKQLKSYGISCGSKIVTPESVLAKTCITVIPN